jgi:peptidoglycan biosynthesis protein MviN/MurJ (putative lipid II flippase)
MEADEKVGAYVRVRRTVLRESRRARARSPLLAQGLNVGLLATCNAGLAILSAWYIVTRIGLNVETDAFFASGALPQLVFLVLSATLLPVLTPLLATKDAEGVREEGWALFQLTMALFGVVGVVLYATCGVWAPLLVPGFADEGKRLTVSLTRIQIVSMVLNAGIVTLWAVQHARRRFVWVEFSGVLANLAGLLFLFYTLPRFGIQAAAWNTIFFNGLKLILLLPLLGRWRRPTRPSPTAREVWRLLKPFLPWQACLRAEPLLDRFLASTKGAGSLSLLYVAQQIYANVIIVTSKALVAPLAPRLAVKADAADWRGYRRVYRARLLLVALFAVAGASLLLAFGPRTLRLGIGHAGVTTENVYTLWLVMLALAGAFAGGVAGQVTSGAFYAMGDTRTPTKVSAVVYIFYLPLKIASFFGYGLIGLAGTMSAYFLINFLAQFVVLEGTLSRRLSGAVPAAGSLLGEG